MLQFLMRRKMILFTHTDLDGVGCSVLATLASTPYEFFDDLEIKYEQPSTINYSLIRFINEGFPKVNVGDELYIYITDLGPSVKVLYQLYTSVEMINRSSGSGKVIIRVLDHHITSNDINQFPFATSCVFDDKPYNNQLTCGTKLLYTEFTNLGVFDRYDESLNFPEDTVLEKFVDLVRLYDTFEWQKQKCIEAYNLNLHHTCTPAPQFITDIIQRLMVIKSKDEPILEPLLNTRYTSRYYDILDTANEICDHYDELLTVYVPNPDRYYGDDFLANDGYYRGIILFHQSNNSLVSNIVAEQLQDKIDFVANLSIRSYGTSTVTLTSVKEDVDVSKIAKMNGGGGHKHAAGFSITADMIDRLRSIIHKHLFIE